MIRFKITEVVATDDGHTTRHSPFLNGEEIDVHHDGQRNQPCNLALLHPKMISESAFGIKSAFDVKSAFRYHFCLSKALLLSKTLSISLLDAKVQDWSLWVV